MEAIWMNPTGIAAAAAVVSAAISALTLRSLILFRKQITLDHERSRRERALDLLVSFVNLQNPVDHEATYALRLIYRMSSDQCRALCRNEPFAVDEANRPYLDLYRAIYYHRLPLAKKPDPKSLQLTLGEVIALDKTATAICNRVELIAAAWKHNIADREILEEEFKTVYCVEPDKFILETYRAASGIFPSTKAICMHFKGQQETKPAKQPTGVL
jgi:hypothetical protein